MIGYYELLDKIEDKRSYILRAGAYKKCKDWEDVASYIFQLSGHKFLGWESIKIKKCNKNRYKIRLKNNETIKQIVLLV